MLRDETNLARPNDDVDLLVAASDMQRVRGVLKEHQYLALPALGRGSHTFFVGYHPATESWVTLDIVTELTFGPYLNIQTHAAEGVLADVARQLRRSTPLPQTTDSGRCSCTACWIRTILLRIERRDFRNWLVRRAVTAH